jgi:hypothetical protein
MRQRVSASFDGELPEPGRAELTWHLDRCEACAQFALGVARFTEVLRADRPSDARVEPGGASSF